MIHLIISYLFFFQRLDSRLVIPDGGDLRAEHDGGEESKEESPEEQEEDEDDGGGRTVDCAGLPVAVDAGDEVMDAEEETVPRDETDVENEEDEEFLVLLPNTIVHPGAVVVHLLDAPDHW